MTRPYATDEQYERWFMAECCRCGLRRHKAGTWPDGYVCRTCSDRAVRTRGTCPGCGEDRALPGLRPGNGAAICTTCAGFSQTFDCSRCGFEGKLLGGRLCERCTLTDRLTALLDDGTGRLRPALVPLFDLLVTMDKPGSGLAWLDMRRGQLGNASQLLRRLGLGEIPLTHDAFHKLQLDSAEVGRRIKKEPAPRGRCRLRWSRAATRGRRFPVRLEFGVSSNQGRARPTRCKPRCSDRGSGAKLAQARLAHTCINSFITTSDRHS